MWSAEFVHLIFNLVFLSVPVCLLFVFVCPLALCHCLRVPGTCLSYLLLRAALLVGCCLLLSVVCCLGGVFSVVYRVRVCVSFVEVASSAAARAVPCTWCFATRPEEGKAQTDNCHVGCLYFVFRHSPTARFFLRMLRDNELPSPDFESTASRDLCAALFAALDSRT